MFAFYKNIAIVFLLRNIHYYVCVRKLMVLDLVTIDNYFAEIKSYFLPFVPLYFQKYSLNPVKKTGYNYLMLACNGGDTSMVFFFPVIALQV